MTDERRRRHSMWMREYRRRHPLYGIWMNIRKRCAVCKGANANERRNYIPKGLEMCREWKASFPAFEEWALSGGWKPGMWVGRMSVDLGYSPVNCVVCTQREQMGRRDASSAMKRSWAEGTFKGKTGRYRYYDRPQTRREAMQRYLQKKNGKEGDDQQAASSRVADCGLPAVGGPDAGAEKVIMGRRR